MKLIPMALVAVAILFALTGASYLAIPAWRGVAPHLFALALLGLAGAYAMQRRGQ